MTTAALQGRALARPERPDGLWERDDSLARLRRLVALAETGAGGTVVIRGGTGTGRTALLETAAWNESLHGTTVLSARCSAQESNVTFGALLQLFDTALREGPALTPVCGSEQWDGSMHGTDLPSQLWRLLRSMAAAGPVLLTVDDVHLADPLSRRWLTQVARRLDQLPVLLVVTERWQYDLDPPAPAFADSFGQPSAAMCTLKSLSPQTCAQVVRTTLGGNVPLSLVRDCVQATGGNPMLLHALLADLCETATSGLSVSRLPSSCAELYPGAYTSAVGRWLQSAGTQTVAVAQALAELQDEQDALALLPDVTSSDPARLAGWTAELARHGLLRRSMTNDRWVLSHPLLRDAVRQSWDQRQRAEVRRRTAELLHSRGAPEDAVVRHLLPIPAVGASWAADALIASAGHAIRAGRTEEAVACLRRALEEPLPARRRSTVLSELGSLEVQSEQASGVRHLTEALRLEPSSGGKVRAASALGAALVARGEVHTALDVLRELSDACADSIDLAHALQAATAVFSSHDGDSWLRVVAQLRLVEERSPDGVAPTAHALITEHAAAAGLLSANQVMERVRLWTATPLDPLLEPYLLASAATLAQGADQLQEADQLVARGLAARQPQLLHPAHQRLVSVRAQNQVMRGRYSALLTDTALPGFPPTEDTELRPNNFHLHAQTLIALTETGQLAEAQRLADAVTAGGRHGSWEWNEFLYARGLLLTASGDPRGGLCSLLDCGQRQSAREAESPIATPWRSAAADCYVALGSPERAVPLAAEELRLAQIWGTPRTVGRALRALAVSLGGQRGLELAEEAVGVLRSAAEPLPELVAALVSFGQGLYGAGQCQRARAVLREAAREAERLGAAAPRRTVAQALLECGARQQRTQHTGVGALTPSELRVAQMAAAGHRNGEIAALLQLAVRTVETHLTHCYRKLGIRRRTDLRPALGDAT